MIETENKVYARRCESHVEALRRAVPGCIEKVEWQCEDQLTITVKQDKLPEAVHVVDVLPLTAMQKVDRRSLAVTVTVTGADR